jgi:outer membrane protein
MKILYLILTMIFLLAGSGYAAEKPIVVTLNECINIALHNNQSIMVSEEDKKKALADYDAALAQRLIMIDANLSTRQYPKTTTTTITTSDVTIGTLQWYEMQKTMDRITLGSKYYYIGMAAGATATISLYNERKNQAQKSAKAGIKLSKHQSLKVIQEVIFNVKKAYYAYINSKEYKLLRERLLKSNEDRLKLTQILYKNAQKPLLDLSKAKLDYNEAQLELQKSKNNERTSKAELFLAMGLEAPANEISLQDVERLPELKLSLDELNRYGENNYPDVLIIKSQKEINRIKVAIEMGGHYPDVDIQAGAFIENGGFPTNFKDNFNWNKTWSWTAYGNFIARIPIFSSGLVSSKVKSAESDYKKSVYKEKEVMTAMKSTIETNYNLLNEFVNQVNISKLMLENAEKHILLAKKTYESGAGTQLDLHDANVSLVNAQMGYLKAKYDYLMTMARLSSIVCLGEDTLCKK